VNLFIPITCISQLEIFLPPVYAKQYKWRRGCALRGKNPPKLDKIHQKQEGRVRPENLLYVTKDGVNETFLTLGLM
jgi:hypothetical protein